MTKDLKASMPSGDPAAAWAVRADTNFYFATFPFLFAFFCSQLFLNDLWAAAGYDIATEKEMMIFNSYDP